MCYWVSFLAWAFNHCLYMCCITFMHALLDLSVCVHCCVCVCVCVSKLHLDRSKCRELISTSYYMYALMGAWGIRGGRSLSFWLTLIGHMHVCVIGIHDCVKIKFKWPNLLQMLWGFRGNFLKLFIMCVCKHILIGALKLCRYELCLSSLFRD